MNESSAHYMPPMSRSRFPFAALTRRSFLTRGALVGGWLTLARLPRTAVAAPAEPGPLLSLSAEEAALVVAIGERMTFTGDPTMPTFSQTAALQTIDQTLLLVDESVREQLGWLFTLFEWGPPVFDFQLARYTNLSPEAQDEYIRGWANSRIGVRRVGFQALKNLTMLGYYSQDETWKGLHYRGPWLPRPRRTIA